MGRLSDTARLWAKRVRERNRRASESRPRPRKKLESDGAAVPSTMRSRAMTRISSTRVNAREACPGVARMSSPRAEVAAAPLLGAGLLPVGDVVFIARPAIGAQGHEVVGVEIVFARPVIGVGVAPGI